MAEAEQPGNVEFTVGYVQAAGFHMRYVEAGQGRAVVLLHGGAGLMLSKVHHELAKKYHVIAFEMPGFGQSPINATSQSV